MYPVVNPGLCYWSDVPQPYFDHIFLQPLVKSPRANFSFQPQFENGIHNDKPFKETLNGQLNPSDCYLNCGIQQPKPMTVAIREAMMREYLSGTLTPLLTRYDPVDDDDSTEDDREIIEIYKQSERKNPTHSYREVHNSAKRLHEDFQFRSIWKWKILAEEVREWRVQKRLEVIKKRKATTYSLSKTNPKVIMNYAM